MNIGKGILIVAVIGLVVGAIVFKDSWVPDGRPDIGDAAGQFKQGEMYENGWGRAADPTEAIHWYKLAGEQGHAESQYRLGNFYYKGRFVSTDYVEAAKWYQLAADNQHVEAMVQLAWMYRQGEGIAKDTEAADRWTRAADALSPSEAQP